MKKNKDGRLKRIKEHVCCVPYSRILGQHRKYKTQYWVNFRRSRHGIMILLNATQYWWPSCVMPQCLLDIWLSSWIFATSCFMTPRDYRRFSAIFGNDFGQFIEGVWTWKGKWRWYNQVIFTYTLLALLMLLYFNESETKINMMTIYDCTCHRSN